MRGLLLLGCGMVGILEGPAALRALQEGHASVLPALVADGGGRSNVVPMPRVEPEPVQASVPVRGPGVRVAVEVLSEDAPPLLDAGALSGRPTTQEVGGQ